MAVDFSILIEHLFARTMAIYHLPFCARTLQRVATRYLGRPSLPQIIINHVEEDQAPVDELHASLEREGWEVVSNRHLPAGRRLDEYLEVALTSVQCVVTVWSASSVASPRVRDVANEAQRLGLSVPVVLDSVLLPLGHRSVKTLALHDPDTQALAFQPIVSAIERVIAGEMNTGFQEEDNPSLSVIEALSEDVKNKYVEDNEPDIFYIGPWRVDPGANVISQHDQSIRIQPRAMEVLVYLVSKAPKTVSIEEILNEVWADRVVVDSAVHRCVRELRRAFNDDARSPYVIETIARRGYRILAEVSLTHQANISES